MRDDVSATAAAAAAERFHTSLAPDDDGAMEEKTPRCAIHHVNDTARAIKDFRRTANPAARPPESVSSFVNGPISIHTHA